MKRLRDLRQDVDDSGAILILALVFMLVSSLTIYAILDFAGNSLLDSQAFRNATGLDYAVSSAVQIEAQNLRYNYEAATNSAETCTPSNTTVTVGSTQVPVYQSNNESVVVYCNIVDNPDSAATRVITFSACTYVTTETSCLNSPFLQAVVTYDDYSESNQLSCNSASDEITCGTAMSVSSWDIS
jgi:hypothetical protein